MSEPIPIPSRESLNETDIKTVRWQESIFVEENYTVEYAHDVQHRRLVQYVVKALEARPTATVADLGCGEGLNLLAVCRQASREGVRYIGVDLNRAALQRAANRIAYRGYRNVELLAGDVLDTGLPAASADVVLSSEVIEHLRDPQRLLREIWRVLAPGGTAIITTPNLSNYPRRIGNLADRFLRGRLRDRAYAGMADRAEGTGFTPDEAAGILGHVSEKPARIWRQLARQTGFRTRLYRGSTLVYGYPWLARHPALFGLLCLADGLLGCLPRWVDTSHDLLMVVTKDPGA
jgi:2-polyprenyl-3-methyl-5-hydroxy-6-metoxy-1,4-benzoquinol methylase